MEDAAALLQTGRRLASAAFRRESVCWSEDSFSPSNLTANAMSVPASRRASKSGAASGTVPSDAESVSQLLAHVKLLLRRCAVAVVALDAGLPAEAVRHFATACLVKRTEAFRSSGRPADAIADCNRALALDPGFLRQRSLHAEPQPLLEQPHALREDEAVERGLSGPVERRGEVILRQATGERLGFLAEREAADVVEGEAEEEVLEVDACAGLGGVRLDGQQAVVDGPQHPPRHGSAQRASGELERRRLLLRHPRLPVGVEDAVAEQVQVSEHAVLEGALEDVAVAATTTVHVPTSIGYHHQSSNRAARCYRQQSCALPPIKQQRREEE
uniref:Uncharacterized protein n=1 Tax=Oryza brachyantha TaxID=4533 RepID=J3LI59_ORYBR